MKDLGNSRNRLRGAVLAILAGLSCMVAAPYAQAQVLYGSLIGTVSDPSGSVIPNATISAKDQNTGIQRDATSDSAGRYSFVNVQPGRYNIKVTAKGFKSFTKTDIDVTPGSIAREEALLEVGQMTETITVSGSAAELQTDKSDSHSVIETKAITSLPLGGYRNYQTLINLVPGATPAALQNSITDTPGRALATNINGGNAQTNITRIDGAASVNVWLPHHVGYVTPEENVEVVNITTGAGDAEQGMAGSSAITLVTKSGTNSIHGSLFEFHDDQHLKSRNYFQAFGTAKPLSIYNNYGGSFGGPVIKNKLFYFASVDQTNQRQSSPGFYTVPTSVLRAGDFSGVTATIYDPLTGAADGSGRTGFAGNKIPASRIDPIALKIQNYYPAVNYAGTNPNVNNYYAAGGPLLDRIYTDGKLNYTVDSKQTMFAKYSRMHATAGGKAVFGVAGGSGLGGSDPGLGDTTVQVATLGTTRTITPNMLVDSVTGYERQDQIVTPNDYGTNYGTQFGIPNTNGPDPRQSGFPNIGISGYNGFGVPNWMPVTRVEESYTHSDNVTWSKGAHELRFGFDLVRHHLNHWQPEIGQGPRGYLGFSGQETALKGGAAQNQFNGYAAFLLGLSDDAEKSLQYVLATGREWQFGWYVRDRWQVNRKLTINIGLRYELYPLMTRAGKGLERYDPSNNTVYLGGRGGVPDNAGISVSHKLFAPRVGLAYRVDDKTVIRAGYGINFDPIPFSRPLRGWYPLVVNQANVASGYGWASTFSQGVPNTTGPDLSSGQVSLPGNVSERSPNSFIHRGYVQSWNATIERKLPLNFITSVAYVGTHSVHLLADYDINAGSPGSGTTGLPQYAKYGRTIPTNMWDGYLSSNYNSLQVAVNRSFAKGLMVKGAYTYSKAIDYTDADGWASVGWNWAPVFQRNRAAAGFDRKQVLQMGWVYELPFGKGKDYAKSGIAAAVLGNWQVNGVLAAYTGTPFSISAPASALNAPNNSQTANQVKPTVNYINNFGPGGYFFDTTAFTAVTAANTFGNSGRNILRAPGVFNVDLNITREFVFQEKYRLQFRTEMFNFDNHPHFGGPSTSVTSGTFGQITSAGGERQVRFGLRAQW